MENPNRMDDFGGTTIFGNTHIGAEMNGVGSLHRLHLTHRLRGLDRVPSKPATEGCFGMLWHVVGRFESCGCSCDGAGFIWFYYYY